VKETIRLEAQISSYQVVNLSGKSLISVKLVDGILQVIRKRYRSSEYDLHFYPIENVMFYSEGEGGKEGTAYVIVMQEIILKNISGEGIINENFARIVDAKGTVHNINIKNTSAKITVTSPQTKIVEEEDSFKLRKSKSVEKRFEAEKRVERERPRKQSRESSSRVKRDAF
jgi:hypothetical protein